MDSLTIDEAAMEVIEEYVGAGTTSSWETNMDVEL